MSTRGYVGRDVMLEYSLQPKDTAPESLVFVRLGMCQEKELNTTWDTVDATGDTSPNFTKENLVAFKSVAITGGYVSMGDDVENQAAFEDHIFSPPAETNYQPFMHLRITFLNGKRVITGPFIVSENGISMPHGDAVKGSFSSMSDGNVTSVRA